MERQQLIYFQKAARLNNMSRAAKELHITQPALSKSIAGMESELGLQLFHRMGKRVVLNEIGGEVLNHVDKILDEFNSIYHIASKKHQPKMVHILAKAADQLIPEMVFRINEKHPDIKIQVSHYSSGQDADIVITSSLNEYEGEDGLTVLKEDFVLVVPSTHPFAGREYIELGDLKDESLVVLSEGIPLRDIILHWLGLAGVNASFSYECDSCGVMRELINSGRGVGMVPSKTWSFPYNKAICVIPIRNNDCYRYVNVVCSSNEKDSAASTVYQLMVSYLEKFDIG